MKHATPTPSHRRRRRRAPWTAVLVWSLLAALGGAQAQAARPERDRRAAAKAEVQKAQLSYKLGRFDEALQAYTRAYEMFNAPALLFNMGQCHKNLKNYERAIFFFQGYLREETKADPRKRQLAEDLIVESRAEQQKLRLADEEAQRAAAPPPVTLRPAPAPPPQAPILVDEPRASGEQEKRATPLLRRAWFWTGVGAGAILLGGGALAYYFSGPTTTVLPGGSVGTLDRR